MPEPPIEVVSRAELCRRFNDGGYWHRVQTGDGLYRTLEEDGVPSPPRAGEPPGTHSRIFAYRSDTDGQLVARVHQYDRPDGSIGGARGEPEPKMLLEDGVLYIVVDAEDWGGAEGA